VIPVLLHRATQPRRCVCVAPTGSVPSCQVCSGRMQAPRAGPDWLGQPGAFDSWPPAHAPRVPSSSTTSWSRSCRGAELVVTASTPSRVLPPSLPSPSIPR
jgi:hypothetical protein